MSHFIEGEKIVTPDYYTALEETEPNISVGKFPLRNSIIGSTGGGKRVEENSNLVTPKIFFITEEEFREIVRSVAEERRRDRQAMLGQPLPAA